MTKILKQKVGRRAFAFVLMIMIVIGSIITVTALTKSINTNDEKNNITISTDNKEFTVSVFANGKTQQVKVPNTAKVADALKSANITINKNDKVYPDVNASLANDMQITVSGIITMNLKLDGVTMAVSVPSGTVQDALDYLGVKIYSGDVTSVPFTASTSNGMNLTITRANIDNTSKVKTVPYKIIKQKTSALYVGTTKVQANGQNGQQEVVCSNKAVNGKKATVSTNVIIKPVNKVILVGTKQKPAVKSCSNSQIKTGLSVKGGTLVDSKGNKVSYKKVIYGSGTAYSSDEGALTSTGVPVYVGGVAVNPNVIPYGSKLYITNQNGNVCYGYATAVDTGGALMDGSALVDCYFPSTSQCINFGRQNVAVYILN
ncbi:MAG: ubiquitin-like domain-containing protein [Bacillota bacterium]|nr:ubiquitin-like domain-containing protein [Bacillota bacterium]